MATIHLDLAGVLNYLAGNPHAAGSVIQINS